MSVRFDGRVAIITGAGGGLGRAHALGLAARGAKIVVNDVGDSGEAAVAVVEEIRSSGGQAMADSADVADFAQVQAMVDRARAAWGRVDILVNNAGILRDKSFAKMELSDFRRVLDVHLMGSVHCCKAVWATMREQGYGRIVMTSSSSGLYGNFGQSNYGAAKAALVGLMNVLHQEGRRHDIRVNTLAPTAVTRMTEGLVPESQLALLRPEAVTPGLLYLVSDDAPSRIILCAGAGVFATAHIVETAGLYLSASERTPETIAARFGELVDRRAAEPLESGPLQTERFIRRAEAEQA